MLGDVVLRVDLVDRGLRRNRRAWWAGRRRRNLFATAVHRHDIQGCSTGDQEDGHNNTARRTKMESSDAEDDFEEETEGDKQNECDLHDLLTPVDLCRVAGALAPEVLTKANTPRKQQSPRI